MIKAIIVEDERHLADYLKEIISEIDDTVRVMAICPDVHPGIEAIEKHQPELIFLDIMLPGGSGFDLLDVLPGRSAEVIFITAHDSFWQQAFNYAAVGYVLKPVSKEALQIAISNACSRIKAGTVRQLSEVMETLLQQHKGQHDKLAIPTEEGYQFISYEQIVRLEAQNTYTWLFLQGHKKILTSYNLGEFRKILRERDFPQVHKSHIVSRNHIVKFNIRESLLEMSDQSNVPVSRRSRSPFIETLSVPRR